ncbi:hypothetical protein [Methanosarcina sp. DH2]|nr:hypothetical protein [Methanosarcina sp. DH2]
MLTLTVSIEIHVLIQGITFKVVGIGGEGEKGFEKKELDIFC